MQGICSKAAQFAQPMNRYKFNGANKLESYEFSDCTGLDFYDAHHRMYDGQLGRFYQIDKLGDFDPNLSLYNFGSNNPIIRNDPLGLKDSVVIDHGNVTVRSTRRYSTFTWFGWKDDKFDTHWKTNLSTFSYRLRAGKEILQPNDRLSYIEDVINGKIPSTYAQEEQARQSNLLFTASLLSPILLVYAPEFLTILGESSGVVSTVYTEASLILYTETNLAINWVKDKVLTKLLDVVILKLGKDALYSKELWKVSEEIGKYKESFNSKQAAELIKKIFNKLNEKSQN